MSILGRIGSLTKEIIFRIGGVKLQFGTNYLSGLLVRKQPGCSLLLDKGFSCRRNYSKEGYTCACGQL